MSGIGSFVVMMIVVFEPVSRASPADRATILAGQIGEAFGVLLPALLVAATCLVLGFVSRARARRSVRPPTPPTW